MGAVQESFVDALVERHDEVAHRAAERIVGELPGYQSLGEDAVLIIATVVGGFYAQLVERWRSDDRRPPGTDGADIQPAAGIDLGIPLTDRLAAHRIASEVIWDVVHDVATELPDLDTDFLLWATSLAFNQLNALTASVTEQHLEVEHHRRRWRRELERTLVEAALRSPPDLHLATTTIQALGVEAGPTWQVIVILRCGHEAGQVPGGEPMGAWARRKDRTVLTARNGRETKVIVAGVPVEPGDLDIAEPVAAGVSRPRRRLEDLAASYERAYDAAIVAEQLGGGAVGVDETRLERFLAGRVSPDDLSDDLLEPLRALPPERAELVAESLEAYLDGACSVTAAARRLHLHPQSFRYRLGKLQEYFGDDLDDPSRRLLLHVAITRYRQAGPPDDESVTIVIPDPVAATEP